MTKICVIYNMAASYREPVFKLLDKEFEIDWFFGRPFGNIKEINFRALNNVKLIERSQFKMLTWQKSIVKLQNSSNYSHFLVLGDFFCISTWFFALKNRFSKNRKPLYFWSHGWYGREGFIKKILKRVFFSLADMTFLYGNFAKKVAIMQGFPSDKLAVIHNSLDHDNQVKLRNSLSPSNIYHEHFSNDNPVLIFIGRLTKVKSLDMLLDALHLLKQKGKRYNLVFIGDGETRSELEAQTSQFGLTDQVWFYGACYDDTKNAQLIYDSDLCVAPGNVGLTAMHTMVFGTPVLTHDNFPMQMPEFEAITPGKTGAFFRYGDTESLAEEIEKWLIKTDSNREEIRRNCYNEIDSFWTPEYQVEIIKKYLPNL